MEVYQADKQFVLGVNGGEIYSLKSGPKAIISVNRPVPTRMWTIPTIIDKSLHKGEEWRVTTEFREFLCDDRNVYILQFDYQRIKPGYCEGKAEFFLSEEDVNNKLESLRKTSRVSEYTWDPTVPTWKEVRFVKYRKV
ncbi:hypothetical protein ACN6MT_03120 [Neobacillus niacini]|uniref:hypothetical protein n=1 Tax=Neobacillus niacini TaxID=86668 RepID=UPI003B02D660